MRRFKMCKDCSTIRVEKDIKLQHFPFYLFGLLAIVFYHPNIQKNTDAANSNNTGFDTA